MSMIHIHQRQNKHDNWWCSATINGYDYSFEGSIESARTQMIELLKKKGIVGLETRWHEPIFYEAYPHKIISEVGYKPYRIDRGIV